MKKKIRVKFLLDDRAFSQTVCVVCAIYIVYFVYFFFFTILHTHCRRIRVRYLREKHVKYFTYILLGTRPVWGSVRVRYLFVCVCARLCCMWVHCVYCVYCVYCVCCVCCVYCMCGVHRVFAILCAWNIYCFDVHGTWFVCQVLCALPLRLDVHGTQVHSVSRWYVVLMYTVHTVCTRYTLCVHGIQCV